jgi:hypothetical protein
VNINRSTIQAHDGQVIVGIGKHLQNVSSIPAGGKTLTPAELTKLVQSRIDSANAVAAAKAHWHDAVASFKQLNTEMTQVNRDLRHFVIGTFGEASPVLADFGFAPPKRTKLTPEQKAAAAKKRLATRKARHVMGKKQRLNVKAPIEPSSQAPAPPPTQSNGSPPHQQV